MAAESEQPTPSHSSSPEPSDSSPPATGGAQVEHFGPLQLLRTNKADGRALLLFSRAEREPS
jgi:hypothetical protein